MKISFAPVLLCLIQVANAQPKTPETAPVADPVQVEVSTSKPQYLGGEPVIVSVVLRNNTNKAISFLMRPSDFEFDLKNDRNRKGRGIKVVPSAKGRDENQSGVIGERIVEAGKSFAYKVVLSRLFDMSRAGTYTVSGHKNLKLENPSPGGNLIGAIKVARDVKVRVVEEDVAD